MRRFWSDQKGNVAILFALAVVPVLGAMGAAVDYSMANSERTKLQKALDATALALTKIMPANQTTLDTVGNQYFSANMGQSTLTNVQLTITPSVGTLFLSAKGTYTPELANILGVASFEVSSRAEAKWSIGKVEIALALDNTGSMSSSGKITQLKIATNNLLDVLQQASPTPGDAKVAIVPFNTTVNVGTSNVGASWIKWGDWENDQNTTNHGSWTGCVKDRDKDSGLNYDVLDTAPTSSSSTKYPAKQCSGSLVSMMPLGYDWTALHAKVNSMNASGYTNVTIGLVWAWHLLSSTAVYTEGAAYNTANLTKYVILLTDGDNTQNRWTSTTSSIDARTALACTNIKAAGIKIYAIRVIEGNANLLQNCATNTSMYYNVQNASELSAVFSSIGSQIANLHLSK